MEVTDDDVKTRAQKEKLDEITSETPTNDDQPAKPAVTREGTMAVTAKVCGGHLLCTVDRRVAEKERDGGRERESVREREREREREGGRERKREGERERPRDQCSEGE